MTMRRYYTRRAMDLRPGMTIANRRWREGDLGKANVAIDGDLKVVKVAWIHPGLERGRVRIECTHPVYGHTVLTPRQDDVVEVRTS